MHEDFDFLAPLPNIADEKRILRPVSDVGAALAGVALRSLHALCRGATSHFPTPCPGRLVVPRGSLTHHNNLVAGRGAALPVQSLRIPDVAPEAYMVAFTDRTALIAAAFDREAAPRKSDLVTVLPVILRLRTPVTISTGSLRISVVARGKEAVLQIARGKAKPRDLSDRTLAIDMFKALIAEEVAAWAAEIPAAPLMIDPGAGPRAGRLGRDIPAPAPEIDGAAYAWPAAMPLEPAAGDDVAAAERLCKLAFIELMARHSGEVARLSLRVHAATPRQDGRMAPGGIEVRAINPGGAVDEALARRLQAAYRSLLAEAGMRDTVLAIRGQWQVRHGGDRSGIARTRLCPATLFAAMDNETFSRHDQIASLSLYRASASR